jgi:hypothetical protein
MIINHPQIAAMLWLYLIGVPVIGQASYIERLFAPKAELWPRWETHDPTNKRQLDHAAWGSFLEKYTHLDGDGVVRVAYELVTDSDRTLLNNYLVNLADTAISGYSRAEQFAYWVNLYNAQTIALILEHYPVKSIRDIDISPGLISDGPWGKKTIEIEGEPVSLNDIEHRILRPIWRDPRIHYAVNCASIGCPNLQRVAYTAGNTEHLLNSSARAYINHPRGVRVNDGVITASKIYSWFISDFDIDGGVIAHLQHYASPELQASLASIERIQKYEYDWRLNGYTTGTE